jgi:LPS sulfotransferase NodH
MTRFVILAVPRTGSNLLCTLLNSHPQILCHHEVFNPQGVFTALDYQGHGLFVESLRQRDEDPLGFLERVWQTGGDGMRVGFKWTRGQNLKVLNQVVEDAGVKKIVLRRRNRIKTYVSDLIAQETQQWEVYSRQELAMPRPRIHVDAGRLSEHIAVNQQFYADLSARIRQCHQPCFEVDYETLFDRTVQSRMLQYLDIASPDLRLTAASIKQNSTDLRDSIANFAELSEVLAGGELFAELQDCGI